MKSIIMAGGSGTRLWPFSRKNFPKQFLSLVSEDSFIQITAKRLLQFTKNDDIFVVGGDLHKFHVVDQMEKVFNKEYENLILEPMGRNTAPAIALTVKYLLDKEHADKSTVLFFSPSDHLIKPEIALKKAIEAAEKYANKNIVTFGIVPIRAETGYGYVELGDDIDGAINKVKRFVEKPDEATAKKYLDAGNYMWNSGMFMFSIGVILEAFKKYVPELYTMITELSYEDALKNYENLASTSIDYAIMEKVDNILCKKLDINWNDIGSWMSLYEILPKDENNNAILGDVEYVDTKNSLIISNKELVTLIGMDNTVVIATEDAILVSDKTQSQNVKKLVSVLKEKGRKEVDEHVTTYRPWGSYTILEEGTRYKIKRIVVNPEARLSLQRHKHRSEHWVVIKGMAEVEIAEKTQILHENESAYVPIYEKHRLTNTGKIPLEIIEVQNGEYVGEDDIERFEDSYGRA